jgi:ketosteroid isomerase-like protein
MSKENVEVVRRLFAEWERGNFWAMTELYAPDVEWHWSRHARALRGGSASYRGLEEIGAAMQDWLSDWGWFRVSADEFIDAGDHVVVMTQVHARLKGDRGEVRDHQADVITVRDGKIVRMETFDGRLEALEALGLSE